MKRLLTLAAVLVLVFSFAAFGAVQDFGRFTLDVPDGWTGQFQDPSAIITKNDNSAQLVVTVSSTEGASLGDIAAGVAEAFKQQGFTKDKKVTTVCYEVEVDDEGDYSWEMKTANGVVSRAFFGKTDSGKYGLVVFTGDDAALGEIAGSVVEK